MRTLSTYLVLTVVLATLSLALLGPLGASADDDQVAAAGFSTTLPASGVALTVWDGGSVAEIVTTDSSVGSVWISVGGSLIGYVVGAPDFANAAFLGSYPGGEIAAGTPMIAVVLEGAAQPVPTPTPTPNLTDTYTIVDTGQIACYSASATTTCPAAGQPFSGQDAQHQSVSPAYQDNGDGTITDLNTGLVWQQDPGAKMTVAQATAGAGALQLAGYDDWRLPSIKELYSLMDFTGVTGTSAASSTPYLDTAYFLFEYGDTGAGERFIDAQFATSTNYVSTTMNGDETVFGVNFADGRIKGYPLVMQQTNEDKTFFVRYVRGNTNYGLNNLSDNGDGSISDLATGLIWAQADSGQGMDWEASLAWVEQQNAANYLGHNDWRLPNAKELQSLVDYSRSPATTNSAAIDPLFQSTVITDEGGGDDYPFYWTSTTHLDGPTAGDHAVYIAFGEGLGFMESPSASGNYQLLDVHGAGVQRSDPKIGDPADYPLGHGPQGDVIRIFNYVRLVRG